MNKSMLRTIVVVAGLATAVIHLFLNVLMGSLSIPFTLNGLGYLALTGAFAFDPPALRGQRRLLHYAFMAFAAVTIVAWFVLGDMGDVLGIVTKLIEVALIAALAVHLKAEAS